MLVLEDERPGVVSAEDNCALVDAVVVPIAVADVDVVVVAVVAVVVAAIVDDFVAVVGGLAAVQLATGRLEQSHSEGFVAQSCVFR
jgi:hypothetical protein